MHSVRVSSTAGAVLLATPRHSLVACSRACSVVSAACTLSEVPMIDEDVIRVGFSSCAAAAACAACTMALSSGDAAVAGAPGCSVGDAGEVRALPS